MAGMIHIADKKVSKTSHLDEFKKDILTGFERPNKQIHSKYFYDEHGSELFNRITRHPDYYLTNCEVDILNACKNQLVKTIGNDAFNLIELGPGEGIKTKILIDEFLRHSLTFRYTPIDISANYLVSIVKEFSQQTPTLKITPIHADYFKGLEWQSEHSDRRNLVLFLGSSIGNFTPIMTSEFLQHLWSVLHDGDYVLLGFDLRKDVSILMQAYNDSEGITRDFNLNLLKRINRELYADFNVEKFQHYPTYNVYTGAMESYLISLETQIVKVGALQQLFKFHAIEPIHVEYSYKYDLLQIEKLARSAQFDVVQHFIDPKQYFVDSLWRVNKTLPNIPGSTYTWYR